MKLKDVLEKSIQFFKEKKFETPRLDAEFLIACALGLERMQLYLRHEAPLSESEVSKCRELIRRRNQGEPVAYITEEKGFYGLLFKVGAGVLIPRPESEHLVEAALEFIKKESLSRPRILDLGAGSGCIGFSILHHHPEGTLVSVEKSPAAFKYLKENCEKLNLSSRVELIFNDVNDLVAKDLGKFDIILANPPYISPSDPALESMVKKFEPNEALFAEDNGLLFLKEWSIKFFDNLNKTGLMAFEMGYLQGAEMKKVFGNLKVFKKIDVIKDLSGLDRIIVGAR